MVHLDESTRQTETDFWRDFEAVAPRVLGRLLDAVVGALANVDGVHLDRLPRMADFATWATAAEPALGWQSGDFMAAYDANRLDANALALEASVIGSRFTAFVESRMPSPAKLGEDVWRGTATELLTVLDKHAGFAPTAEAPKPTIPKGWPANGRVLSTHLRRLAPNLRAEGIDLTFTEPTGSQRQRNIVIRTCAKSGTAAPSGNARWTGHPTW